MSFILYILSVNGTVP